MIIDLLDITNPHCKTMYDPVIYLDQWKEGVFGITSKILESDNFFSLESPQWGYRAFLERYIHSRILPFRYIPQCNDPWKRLKLNTWLLACRVGFIKRFKNINQVVWFFFCWPSLDFRVHPSSKGAWKPHDIGLNSGICGDREGYEPKTSEKDAHIRSTCPIWPRNYSKFGFRKVEISKFRIFKEEDRDIIYRNKEN